MSLLCSTADFDDEAVVHWSSILPNMQEYKSTTRWKFSAHTWFFSSKAWLAPAKAWKDVLRSQENHQKECIGVTTACSNFALFAGLDLESISVLGSVHGDEHILLGSLKLWLPMNHLDLPKLLEITLEVILPGRQQHNQRDTKHPNMSGAGCSFANQSCIHLSSFGWRYHRYSAKDCSSSCCFQCTGTQMLVAVHISTM